MAKNEEFTGLQKAAILLITLGPERSADIFKHLKEDEIEELTLEIANTRSISPQVKEDVLNEFYQICLAQQYIAEGGIGRVKRAFPVSPGAMAGSCTWPSAITLPLSMALFKGVSQVRIL